MHILGYSLIALGGIVGAIVIVLTIRNNLPAILSALNGEGAFPSDRPSTKRPRR